MASNPNDMHGAGDYAFSALDESKAAARRKVADRNFALISSAAASLGGVPAMLTAEDCCAPGGPHEHAVIGYGLRCLSFHMCTHPSYSSGEDCLLHA